jgi:hypothetical protein
MARTRHITRQVVLAAVSAFIFSCATVEQPSSGIPDGEEKALSAEYFAPLVYGQGEGTTEDRAMETALRDGARKAAEALLGPGAALKNQEALDKLFSGPVSIRNSMYHENSIEVLGVEDSPGSEGRTVVIRGRLDLPVLINHLKKAGFPEELLPGSGKEARLSDETMPAYAAPYLVSQPVVPKSEPGTAAQETQEPDSVDITGFSRIKLNDEEQERLTEYLNSIVFMIHTGRSAENRGPYDIEAARVLAGLLTQHGYACRYPDQVEVIRDGQQQTYLEETNGEVPLLQWTAAKLTADMYLEVDSEIKTRRDSGGFYATASVEINLIDTLSWDKAASLSSRESPPAFSAESEQEAVGLALGSVFLELLPELVAEARESYGRAMIQGIPYELILLNSPGQQAVKRFLQDLEGGVRKISRLSASSGEARFKVWFLGSIEDLESLVYTLTPGIEGMENFSPAYQRGNELAFYAGLF